MLNLNGRLRVCGDFKITTNQVMVRESNPIPRIKKLFAKLRGGRKFTKLDLKDAYQQISVVTESQELVTINTEKGLVQLARLLFGVVSALALFLREMENFLGDLPHVTVYLYDILVTGSHGEDN